MAIAFYVGDIVFDATTGERVHILDVQELWDYVTYRVFNPISGRNYKLAAKDVSPSAPLVASHEGYVRYRALLARIKDETSSGVLSGLASGVIPLPHQMHVLHRVLSGHNIRYILADEVGLGKTIEAGLVIKELKARGLVHRVLVVCPTGLVTQWRAEMLDKFGEHFRIIYPDDHELIRDITANQDVYGQFDLVISPMDSIKPLERRVGWDEERIQKYNEERIQSIINSGWDLIIIDEAHRVAGSSGDVARHRLGSLLAEASPYLFLLTATPHNGKTEPFLRLVRLVDAKAFPSARAVVKEQVAPYVVRTSKRDAIDASGKPLFTQRTTKAISLHWDERHSLQRELYDRVTKYVAFNYDRAQLQRGKHMWLIFLLILMQRLVSSSTRAIRESLERRLLVLEQQGTQATNYSETRIAEMELEESLEEALGAVSLDIASETNSFGKF